MKCKHLGLNLSMYDIEDHRSHMKNQQDMSHLHRKHTHLSKIQYMFYKAKYSLYKLSQAQPCTLLSRKKYIRLLGVQSTSHREDCRVNKPFRTGFFHQHMKYNCWVQVHCMFDKWGHIRDMKFQRGNFRRHRINKR